MNKPHCDLKKAVVQAREKFVTTIKRLCDYAQENYPDLYASTLLDTDVKYTYSELFDAVKRVSDTLLSYGFGAGSKAAIWSQNMPNWTVAFLSATNYSRVSIPILAESSETEVENILEHSETSVLFASEAKLQLITPELMDRLQLVIKLEDLSIVKAPASTTEGAQTRDPEPDTLAGIFYTSGTTGRAKGVMLSHRNLCQNVIAASYAAPFNPKDRWLSILPMAHTYEMAFSLLYPIFAGGHVHYLQKAPTVSVLTHALAQVKPQVVCSVPLIIEKIYRSSVRKTIDKSKFLSWMEDRMPRIIYPVIGKKILKFFGGELLFFGVGGAKLDPIVEAFLKKAKFPYAIGYGLTETAPLICYAAVGATKTGSIGINAKNVEVRLGDINPETGEGEIQCKGPNVMLGYYKDEERTKSVFTEDGWFRTGDLAVKINKRYYIRGRLGSMFVGPSGENVYPEEIESIINNYRGVAESLVVKKGGKLVALVKFDESVINYDQNREDKILNQIEETRAEIMKFVNERVRKSNNINDVEIMDEPFVKTATMKIKRFLYQDKDKK